MSSVSPSVAASYLDAMFMPATQITATAFSRSVERTIAFRAEDISHVKLRPGFLLDGVRVAGVSWEFFVKYFSGKAIWLADEACVYGNGGVGGYGEVLRMNRTAGPGIHAWLWGDESTGIANALFCSAQYEEEMCEFIFRFMVASDPHNMYIGYGGEAGRSRVLPLPGRMLSELWARDNLDVFRCYKLSLTSEHWRALETVSRDDLELVLAYCELGQEGDGSRAACTQCLQASKGPTALLLKVIGTLTHDLIGNSRISSIQYFDVMVEHDAAITGFFQTVVQIHGLVHLNLRLRSFSSEPLVIFWRVLEEHPTLAKFVCRHMALLHTGITGNTTRLTKSQKTELTLALANLVRETPSLKKVEFNPRDEQVYAYQVVPYLDMNIHLPRVKAIAKIKCTTWRRKVLGRALSIVQDNPNLFWMYLWGNMDAVFVGR